MTDINIRDKHKESNPYSKEGKIMKKNNKGFTLVELIVVLVILAILAAILVPTLLGYIDRARSEKDFSTAQTVRVAAQAEIDQIYGDTASATLDTFKGIIDQNTATYGQKVYDLSGVSNTVVTEFKFAYKKGVIYEGYVKINNSYYKLDSGTGQWSVVTTAPTINTPS